MSRVESHLSSSFLELLFSALIRIIWLILKTLGRLLQWAILFPLVSVPIVAVLAAWGYLGRSFGLTVLVVTAAGFISWRVVGATSFRRIVIRPIRQRHRRWKVYLRRWNNVCALHHLTAGSNGSLLIPPLRKIKMGESADTLAVNMLLGQTIADWSEKSEALAHAFGATSVRIRSLGPGWISIVVNHTDSLITPLVLKSPYASVDLTGVIVGRAEDGGDWTLPVLGRHVLIAGATGAGKGSVLWSIIAGLAPDLHEGRVALWVVDPKGGMELGRGIQLFDRFSTDAGEQTLALLREAANLLRSRAQRLRGVTRQLEPTSDDPLVVIIIDELASLTAYVSDRKLRTEIEQLLGLILSQGRAVGISVVACVQDPSKEVLSVRQLFPIRVALRLSEASQVSMALGIGAREKGALCDLIPDALPGVGFFAEEGRTEISRVRAFQVTDEDIDLIAAKYSIGSGGAVEGAES
jgi:S-DNA-T family DNA segregation ATPase FtsK/SpoIIIE